MPEFPGNLMSYFIILTKSFLKYPHSFDISSVNSVPVIDLIEHRIKAFFFLNGSLSIYLHSQHYLTMFKDTAAFSLCSFPFWFAGVQSWGSDFPQVILDFFFQKRDSAFEMTKRKKCWRNKVFQKRRKCFVSHSTLPLTTTVSNSAVRTEMAVADIFISGEWVVEFLTRGTGSTDTTWKLV